MSFRLLDSLHFGKRFAVTLSASSSNKPKLRVPADRALFHITHWKAGSQWIRGILNDVFADALVGGDYLHQNGLDSVLENGKVYTGLYLAKQEFEAMALPKDGRRVVLIRDLRDTLISGYFSIRYTHGVNMAVKNWRRVLNNLNPEDGLLYLMEGWLKGSAVIHRTWLEGGERCMRLEDFMTAPADQMALVLQTWGFDCDRRFINDLMERHAYEKYSGGRAPGQENLQSHYRKGVHGDWRLHFTPKVTARFKKLYGDILISAGYERDESW